MELAHGDYCHDSAGGFRQRDLAITARYDAGYLASRYAAIEDKVRALAVRRLRLLEGVVCQRGTLLDFGCGTGHFVKAARLSGWAAHGCDCVPGAGTIGVKEAKGRDWLAATFFDSLEHLQDPAGVVAALRPEFLMVSVPWCHRPDSPDWFMAWKHRRPGEHLWHWGRESLAEFLGKLGYRELLSGAFEDEYRPNPGQEEPNILTGVYRRLIPPS